MPKRKNKGKTFKKPDIKEKEKISFNFNKNSLTSGSGIFLFLKSGDGSITDEKTNKKITIPIKYRNNALEGDYVEFEYYLEKETDKLYGKVISILKPSNNFVVGIFMLRNNLPLVITTDGSNFNIDIKLGEENGAVQDDKVIVKMMNWNEKRKFPIGKVVKILGKAGDEKVEEMAILQSLGIKDHFLEHIINEVNKYENTIPEPEIKLRRDFRNITTITIDPENAKDFDDAISYKKINENEYEIGIHIADVGHFVKKDSNLDIEALKRGNSVYLVKKVVPMLPERLSNDLCSLKPNEDRLTFSAVFILDNDGKILNEWYGKTIIHSDKRYNYNEVFEIIKGKDDHLKEILITLNNIAKKIRKERIDSGAINFKSDEIKFKFDKLGNPIEIIPKIQNEAHQLIEEYMLLANKQVAKYIHRQKKSLIYRVHESPSLDKIKELAKVLNFYGYKLNYTDLKSFSKSLNKVLSEANQKPEESIINMLSIRSMNKAMYSPKNIGHFGLNFSDYAHFTSPIRRYADLVVHRVLDNLLNNTFNKNSYIIDELEKISTHVSKQEIIATKAERSSTRMYQLKMLKEHEGKEFNGIIKGITDFGIFVEVEKYYCEGLIKIKEIDGDVYNFNPETITLKGLSTGKVLKFGDKLKVKIKKINLIRFELDLEIVNG